MRSGSVTDFIDSVKDGVKRCVITDGSVGAVQVVVDSTRESDTGDVKFLCKNSCSTQRTVSADNDKSVDTFFLHIFVCQLSSFGCLELLTACGFEDCTSLLDDITYVLAFEFMDFACYQPFITMIDTFDLQAVVDCRACYGADGSIHTWSITS